MREAISKPRLRLSRTTIAAWALRFKEGRYKSD